MTWGHPFTGLYSGPDPQAMLLLCNLVEELICRLADPLQSSRLRHGQIRKCDIPARCSHLVLRKVIFRLWTANTWPALPCRVDDVQVVGNFRHEVVNIGVPVAVEGSG